MAQVAGDLSIRIRLKQFPLARRGAPLVVFEGFAVAISPGAFVAITGPSGCGKTTLLNVVAGLDTDFEGEVGLGADAPRLAYVFQTPRLLPWRTVRENIALALPDGDARHAGVDALISQVGLAAATGDYPERLSLGMQRRVALARAFVIEPDILLMDEPFVSLDVATAAGLRALLLDLWSRRRATVLFVTHDRTEAVTLATRILCLGGAPARLLQDVAVELDAPQRADPELIRTEARRLFTEL
jgi:ABC-type nitrate/sulfonate/bicarbonate transport system ATPase subunit